MALGDDFWGELDISPAMQQVTGRKALGQAVLRRLTTPTGQLPDYPAYGYDVRDMVGRIFDIEAERAAILAQCLAEEEVQNATVDIVLDDDVYTITIGLTTADEPYELTLNVSELETTALVPE